MALAAGKIGGDEMKRKAALVEAAHRQEPLEQGAEPLAGEKPGPAAKSG
jgi:hypothetical protein